MSTCLEKYGHVVYPHSKIGRPIVRQILKDKYNVSSIAQLKFSQEVRDLLQDTTRFHKEFYEVGIYGLCDRYPELNYNMCRSKLLREGINDVILYTKPESFVKDILDINNIQYEYNTRKIISPLELDFYIPSRNLAIEVCGLYWHRHSLLQDSKYHLKKLELCKEKGIKLLTIFSDVIDYHSIAVRHRILYHLQLLKRSNHARLLTIKDDINKNNIKEFLDYYHAQGSKLGEINLVAVDNSNDIKSVMTFGKPRKGLGRQNITNDNSYEMYRFATSENIPGIGSKLFKYFVRNFNPSQVYSYADRCWGEGEFYQNLGFEYSSSTPPNYWYTNDFIKKIHRFGFTKHSLVKKGYDANLTESQIMISIGYDKIYDCGSNKYIWTR